MLGVDRRLLQNFDWMLLVLVTGLVTMGIVNLVSATAVETGVSGEGRRQLMSLGVGSFALLVTLLVDYRHYERLALPIYAVCLGLLVLTLIIAPVTRGSLSKHCRT